MMEIKTKHWCELTCVRPKNNPKSQKLRLEFKKLCLQNTSSHWCEPHKHEIQPMWNKCCSNHYKMTNQLFFTIHNLSHQSCSKAVTQKVILEFFLQKKKDWRDNYCATTFTTTLLWSTVSGGDVKMIIYHFISE